jgi:thiol-disulfide isomerase/thioredoxin
MSAFMINSGHLAQLAFTVVAAAGVYSFLVSAREGDRRRLCTAACALRPQYANNNRVAPDFELPTIDGSTKKLSDFRGKVVVLNFWTKSCRPCLEEMPALADFSRILDKEGDIQLLTVSTDETVADARDTLLSVLAGDAPFVTFVDTENKFVGDRYGTKLYPETWFIDKEGVIRARFDGAREWMKPLNLEFAQSLRGPRTCQVQFENQEAVGPMKDVCNDIPLSM